ncbi:MAG: chemotaxis-specific protein-glutamate methyltransferase CheB [Acidobacteria bacterium]|nr:chemotaxis-specific protein-glutamate methyltransferase CheB [Acidobacteriota bacterium]
MSGGPLRVVVVDDSSFVRRAISRMLEADDRIEIVAQASTGEELVTHLDEWRPDAITLDLSMPGMGGLQTLDHIMSRRPTPVIILSTHSAKDAPLTIEALHRGATDFIDKQQYSLVDFEALRGVIVQKLLQLRGVSPRPRRETGPAPARERSGTTSSRGKTAVRSPAAARSRGTKAEPPATVDPAARFEVVVVGASTGGPPTIQRVLEDLGSLVRVPVVIVQHMPAGFTRAFAERLNTHLPLHVREAEDGETLLPGTVYIAPAGRHLRLARSGEMLVARLDAEPSQVSHRPSVDILFDSAAEVAGKRTLAVLLTGMGSDGAAGMLQVRKAGGWTLGQDAASCVVHGMPRAAANLHAVLEESSLERLGPRLRHLLGESGAPS